MILKHKVSNATFMLSLVLLCWARGDEHKFHFERINDRQHQENGTPQKLRLKISSGSQVALIYFRKFYRGNDVVNMESSYSIMSDSDLNAIFLAKEISSGSLQ
jgi:hypothetical protein